MSDYLSVGMVFRHETKWLREWVEYHRIIGVDRFYLFNNDAPERRQESFELLKPYIDSGLVVHEFYQHPKPVVFGGIVRRKMVEVAEGRSRWMSILDADEFMFPIAFDGVPDVLREYDVEGVHKLIVGIMTFGSSGLEGSPELTTEAFLKRSRNDNRANTPARRFYRMGCSGRAVDEDWKDDDDGRRIRPTKKLRVNHYGTKSLADWRSKQERKSRPGQPASDYLNTALTPKQFWSAKWRKYNVNDVFDDSMMRFLPKVKEALGHDN